MAPQQPALGPYLAAENRKVAGVGKVLLDDLVRGGASQLHQAAEVGAVRLCGRGLVVANLAGGTEGSGDWDELGEPWWVSEQ